MILRSIGLFKEFFRAESASKWRFGIADSQVDALFRAKMSKSYCAQNNLIQISRFWQGIESFHSYHLL